MEIFTSHGILGLIRILLSPVIFYLILIGDNLTAGVLFLLAALTDFVDGFLVRAHKHNLEFSYFWDGFADRVLIFPTLLALVINGVSLFSSYLIIFYVIFEVLIGIMMTIKRKRFYLFHKHRLSARINVIIVLLVIGMYIIISDYEVLLALIISPFLLFMGLDYFIHYAKRNV